MSLNPNPNRGSRCARGQVSGGKCPGANVQSQHNIRLTTSEGESNRKTYKAGPAENASAAKKRRQLQKDRWAIIRVRGNDSANKHDKLREVAYDRALAPCVSVPISDIGGLRKF